MSEDARRTYERRVPLRKNKVFDINKALEQAQQNLSQVKTEFEQIKDSQQESRQKMRELTKKSIEIKKQQENISKLKAQQEMRTKVLESGTVKGATTGVPLELERRAALKKPRVLYSDIVQSFYDKSNYPSRAEMISALEKRGLAAKEQFKPRNINEALNRFAYAITETIGGGIREATLGFSGGLGVEKRPGGGFYQIVGGLATPTLADYAFGYVWSKLAVTKRGRKIIDKILSAADDGKPVGLTVEEMKQFEKIVGHSGISTDELRNLPKDKLKTLKEVSDYYKKHPADYTAGAAYVPQEALLYEDFIRKYNWDDDAYIDFLKTYGDDFDSDVLVSILFNAPPESKVKILEDVADYNLTKSIPQLTESPKQIPVETPIETPVEEEDETLIQPVTPVQETSTKQAQEQIPTQIQEPVEAVPQETVMEVPTEPLMDELPYDGAPPQPPSVKLSKDPETRRKQQLGQAESPKEEYKIYRLFSNGESITKNIETSSFPDAYKRVGYDIRRGEPVEVEITRMGKTT